jgi:hypothetical protein
VFVSRVEYVSGEEAGQSRTEIATAIRDLLTWTHNTLSWAQDTAGHPAPAPSAPNQSIGGEQAA